MKLSSLRFFSVALAALVLLSLFAMRALAFADPLSPEAIRDAYFLATGDATKRAAFFEKYTHHLPMPQSGPNVAQIEIETPFACVVQDIALHSLNYRAPDAQQDFYGKPSEFRVRVEIYFTATYPPTAASAMQLGSFWNGFHVRLSQGAEIAPRSEKGTPIYSDQTISGYIGATIVADYNVKRIQSGPATVEVTGPDGAKAESAFDLGSLR